MHIEGLDELDNRIIEIIKDNARLTYLEIGAKAGVSRISVKKRMEALEKKGIIQGYKAVKTQQRYRKVLDFFLILKLRRNVLRILWNGWRDASTYGRYTVCLVTVLSMQQDLSQIPKICKFLQIHYIAKRTKGYAG